MNAQQTLFHDLIGILLIALLVTLFVNICVYVVQSARKEEQHRQAQLRAITAAFLPTEETDHA